MNDKLNDKILEEIRNRVIERDQEKKNEHEIKEMREANIEALTELTTLSRQEVEKIADEVKNEHLLKEKQKQKRIVNYSLAGVALIVILFIVFKPKHHLKERTVEDYFTDNSFDWDIINKYKYDRYFKDNQYIFDLNYADWCYWDGINMKLPVNCDIEVESKWLKGKYSSYGIGLNQSDDAYFAFSMSGDGAATFGKAVGGKWLIDGPWKYNIANKGKGQKNIQKIEVRGNDFSYFINDNLVKTGVIDLDIKEVVLRCCGQQQVAFDNVKITNTDSKKVEFMEDFTKPSNLWTPKKNFTSESKFENSKFIFNEDNGDKRNWSESQMHKVTDNCEIELTSHWLTGELAIYGFMILNDDDNYYSFELQNDGVAKLVERKSGAYTYVQNDVKTGLDSDGSLAIKQRVVIKGDKISYYVKDQLIKTTTSSISYPCKIALRVCGKQSVAFEKLKITYFE